MWRSTAMRRCFPRARCKSALHSLTRGATACRKLHHYYLDFDSAAAAVFAVVTADVFFVAIVVLLSSFAELFQLVVALANST
jgi:hypothetical protein